MLILSVIWCVLVIPNAVFYFLNKDARFKRKIHPWWMSGIGFVMMATTFWLERERMTPAYAVLIVLINIAFSLYYIKAIFFCDSCGTTLFRLYPFRLTFGACKCPPKRIPPAA